MKEKSLMSILKRFGWKKADMFNYYCEFIGLDKLIITPDDIIDSATKTELEKSVKKN